MTKEFSKFDKKKIIEQICLQLEDDLKNLKLAALETYKAATDEENKPENEYDTRGLEASYLAGAQAERVQEIEDQLMAFRATQVFAFDNSKPISLTALIRLSHQGKENLFFLMNKGGGISIKFEGQVIRVITSSSPVGEAVVGQCAGDTVVIDSGKFSIEYEIVSVE